MESSDKNFLDRPLHERPRERLAFLGAEKLTDDELISLVFGSGASLPVARKILNQVGGISGLRRLGLVDLCSLPKIGPARASQLKAALELGKRALAKEPLYDMKVHSAQDVALLLQQELFGVEQESFHVLGLDAKHRVRLRHVAAIGQVDRVYVNLADIFRPMIREGMAAVLVAHNHPSGETIPSDADKILTSQIRMIGDLLGIPLLDHIIVGSSGYYSFVEHGILGIEKDI